jgi:hypothetical protein
VDNSFLDTMLFSTVGKLYSSNANTKVDVEDVCKPEHRATLYKLVMFAALGKFADDARGSSASDPRAWARVAYNPASDTLQIQPSASETRQVFTDVIVVVSIIALLLTWWRTMKQHSQQGIRQPNR